LILWVKFSRSAAGLLITDLGQQHAPVHPSKGAGQFFCGGLRFVYITGVGIYTHCVYNALCAILAELVDNFL
jgi:hypothetical protein